LISNKNAPYKLVMEKRKKEQSMRKR